MDKLQNYRIGYVILHYKAIKETKNCIQSILSILTAQDCIIIVDNGSRDNSGEYLQERYCRNTQIEVIISEENLGFAQGNNIGFKRAKSNHKCNVIILLNNDTLIQQKNFREILISNYRKYNYDIVGPKILQRNGLMNPCSPQDPVHISIKRARIGQMSNYIRLFLSYINLDLLFSLFLGKANTDYKHSNFYQENVQIAGCCLIFMEKYTQMFDGLNPNTFMYLEEVLLYIKARKAGLKIAYDPELEVIHLEDVATDLIFKGKSMVKRQFKYRCQIKSFKVLISELKNR